MLNQVAGVEVPIYNTWHRVDFQYMCVKFMYLFIYLSMTVDMKYSVSLRWTA